MITAYLPTFDLEDFESIKALLHPDVTDTYEDWTKLVLDRSHRIRINGEQPVIVKIHPDELAVILTTHRHHGALNALDILADIKGSAGKRD